METNVDIVKKYLEKELKQPHLSTEERDFLEKTFVYMAAKKEKQQAEWAAFLDRMEAKKKRWEQIYPVEGLHLAYNQSDSEGLFYSFGLNITKELSSHWVLKVTMMTHSNQRILFDSIDEKFDRIELNSLEEAEQRIEELLASDIFKEAMENIKKHSQ